jgi:hypothetical protein
MLVRFTRWMADRRGSDGRLADRSNRLAHKGNAVVALLLLVGCTRKLPAPEVSAGDGSAAPSSSVEASAPERAGVPPAIRGVRQGTKFSDWFAARGVDRIRLSSFVVLLGHDRDEASDLLDSSLCNEVTVGGPPEDGLACEQSHVDKAEQRTWEHARIFVVRKGRAVTAFDVVISISSWDMPDIRFVDEAVTVEPGGLTVDVGDRGPEGARFELAGNGVPSATHGCEHALQDANDSLSRAFDYERSSAKRYLTEVTGICSRRGRWSWREGRFVPDPH